MNTKSYLQEVWEMYRSGDMDWSEYQRHREEHLISEIADATGIYSQACLEKTDDCTNCGAVFYEDDELEIQEQDTSPREPDTCPQCGSYPPILGR